MLYLGVVFIFGFLNCLRLFVVGHVLILEMNFKAFNGTVVPFSLGHVLPKELGLV